MRVDGRSALLLSALSAVFVALAAGSTATFPVEGTVFAPEPYRPSAAQVVVTLDGGQQRIGFPRADGRFTVNDVPPGSHALDVIYVACCVYYQVRLDVALDGQVQVAFAEAPGHKLSVPLQLSPAVKAEYFDNVEPFNLFKFIKSPMGLMAVGMVFVVLVLPNMKLDPAEYKAMMEERNQRSSGAADAQEALAAQQPAAAALPAARGPHQRSGGSRRR